MKCLRKSWQQRHSWKIFQALEAVVLLWSRARQVGYKLQNSRFRTFTEGAIQIVY